MDNINEKIELIQEQLHNLENSGFFTEKDMDRLAKPLRIELVMLIGHLPSERRTENHLKLYWNTLGRNLAINKG